MTQTMATGWLQYFIERRSPSMFLSSFFTTKPGGIYNGRKIEVDIQRFSESVAVVIRRGTGSNLNQIDDVTTKEFEPPEYGEAFPADVEDLIERTIGVDPYSDAGISYTAKLVSKIMDYFMTGYDMIVRGIEIQASQILQTAKLALKDGKGNLMFSADFSPKATHFPTVSNTWGAAGSTISADIESLADVIRKDGKINPDSILLGSASFRAFIADEQVQKQLDNRRINVGEMSPRQVESGATFQGFFWIGSYEFMIWTYNEFYDDPENPGTSISYLGENSCVMLKARATAGSPATRLDRISARVPLPLGPDPRVASLVPGRLTSVSSDLDVTPNIWPTANGKQIMSEVLARTMLAPIQIDGFGSITTKT